MQRDSQYVDALIGLSDATGFLGDTRPPAEVMVEVRRALDRAVELDSANGYAFAARGTWRLSYDWDPDGAGRDMRRALRLAPGSPEVAWNYSWYLQMIGAHDSAVAYARRWVALDPTNAAAWQQLGVRLAFARMPDSALAASERGIALDSTVSSLYWAPMHVHLDAGRRATAESAAVRLWRLAEDPSALALLATYYRRSGDRQGAQRVLDRLQRMARTRYVSPSPIGVAYLSVGDRSRALDLLEQAVLNRDLDVQMDMMLNYTPLRNEPRFQAAARLVFGGLPVPINPFP
jgi:Tfp pilus assembly protein PilF